MLGTKPLVSVIIPTYNRAHTLNRAIESVLGQSYSNLEIIVVDDGSQDTTADILKKYPSIIVINQANQGVSAARNAALKIASGQWMALLDSDDEWLAEKIEKQLYFLRAHPHLLCVHSEEIWIRDGVRVNQMQKHQKGGGDQFIKSLGLCVISPSAVMLHRDIFKTIGTFREDYPVCEDYDLWLKLTSQFEIGFIGEPLIKKYGGHEDQLSRKFFAMDYWRIKSIDWVLQNIDLSAQKKTLAIETLQKKAKILLQGYKKHNNLENFTEVENLLLKY